MTFTLRLYHQMPSWVRPLAATWRGYQLRRWRYGPETETLVQEALAREQWTPLQWQRWQEEQLQRLLHHAATQVPYYRSLWQERRRRGANASWELLTNWPVLDKETLRRQPEAFVASNCDCRSMFHEHTGGTTGTPVQLWFPRPAVRAWYALYEARSRRWYGVSRFDRWAIFGGQLVTPVSRRKPPFWVWNAALNQLYMSSYHLAPDLIPYYIEALERYRVRYVLGYTSSLDALAREAERRGWGGGDLQVAVTNAEPVFPRQRDTIAAGLGCPVRENYGMSEIVAAASECEAGALHFWPETGVLETDERGELISTGLLNPGMPLIRYRTGDRVSLRTEQIPCPCGRTLPIFESIEGRTDEVLYTVDGRVVGRLDPVFKADLPIREAQIIQETLKSVRLLYVPAEGFRAAALESIAENLRARLGPVEIRFEPVAEIPRTASGKFRAVICQVPTQQLPVPVHQP